jgi:hypothetical protein
MAPVVEPALQEGGPEFKPHYCQNKKGLQNKPCFTEPPQNHLMQT